MGKKWDYDVPSIEIWKECLRVLKPGGTALIFAGSRTQHRMACSVEDAGFILKDCIMWLYGSGFPKATDISKQLDKKAGKEREIIGKSNRHGGGIKGAGSSYEISPEIPNITAPATPEAILWNGWKSHGLKPAYEPILVAVKPNDGTYANNALKWGVSGLNIDESRIGTSKNTPASVSRTKGNSLSGSVDGSLRNETGKKSGHNPNIGRYPANILLDEKAAEMLDEQSGKISYDNKKGGYTYNKKEYEVKGFVKNCKPSAPSNYGDLGGASRFFYCAKASKKERNMGCEELEPQKTNDGRKKDADNAYQRGKSLRNNNHPTVKPLKLMEYLCILTKTPTGGIVLDPFAGSGTTGIACKNIDRPFILIERDVSYCEIACKRIGIEKFIPFVVRRARED